MFHGLHVHDRLTDRATSRRPTAALPLLLVSGGGVLVSGLIWATHGWADALACYVATIAAIILLVLRLAASRRNRPDRTAGVRDAPAAPVAHTGLSLAESLAKPESRLHRLGG